MSIYISGIDMPTAQQFILIRKTWDGKIYARLTGSSNGWHEVIEIPPHGKLGDLDALAENRLAFEARNYVIRDEYDKGRISGWYDVIRAIRCGDIPAIIPSSQGDAPRFEKTWINEVPAADIKSIIHGRWEPDIEDVKWGSSLIKMKCSNCKNYAHFDTEAHEFILSNYCPNCGADMRKEERT